MQRTLTRSGRLKLQHLALNQKSPQIVHLCTIAPDTLIDWMWSVQSPNATHAGVLDRFFGFGGEDWCYG